jgi:3-oxoacyl-[acyl-carrier-protein] synthase-1
MITAVGVSVPETAASVRARTARFTESVLQDKSNRPFILGEVPTAALAPLAEELPTAPPPSARELRLLRLAGAPIAECLVALDGRPARVGLAVALPELQTRVQIDPRTFVERLHIQTSGRFRLDLADASHLGRAGGLAAIGQAIAALAAGQADIMIAGGIDSYRDLYVLASLDQEGRVKSDSSLDGFIPGEAAAFLLLTTRVKAQSFGLRSLARVSNVAIGFEPGHLHSTEPYRGDGLAATVKQLVTLDDVEAPVQEVYSSMNGESHWAKEWGVCHLRNRALFHPDLALHHPADCYGDTGAAAGPAMVALAAHGISASYRKAPALVYASSDNGVRSALFVGSTGH